MGGSNCGFVSPLANSAAVKLTQYELPGALGPALIATTADQVIVFSKRFNEDGNGWILQSYSPESGPQWTRDFSNSQGMMRISGDGHAWILAGTELHELSQGGNLVKVHRLHIGVNYKIETFVLLPDGYLTLSVHSTNSGVLRPTVTRQQFDDTVLWETYLPIAKELLPREGGSWDTYYVDTPLLASPSLIFVGLSASSGIGCYYALDRQTGSLGWSTDSGPTGFVAVTNPEHILLGHQGYGVFRSFLYDSTGRVEDGWKSHGHVVVTEDQRMLVVEMENVLPSRSRVCELLPRGRIREGPELFQYYTCAPLVTNDGRILFWRDSELNMIDSKMKRVRLHRDDSFPADALTSRMVLTSGGVLVFRLNQSLLFVDADLSPLALSSWPCYLGNSLGNPVIS